MLSMKSLSRIIAYLHLLEVVHQLKWKNVHSQNRHKGIGRGLGSRFEGSSSSEDNLLS